MCKVCNRATWKHNASGAYFRWCKACKRFHEIHAFAGKIRATKCDKCRAVAAARYARRAAEAAPAPAPAATADPGGAVAAVPRRVRGARRVREEQGALVSEIAAGVVARHRGQPVAAPAPAAAAETAPGDAAMDIS